MTVSGSDNAPRIGRFRVVGHLGKGGQGSVFRALDPELGREVALKIIKHRSPDSPESRRFVEEARIAAQIAHPNVIPLYDVLEHNGQTVLVFEYVQGTTLKAMLSNTDGVAEKDALAIMVRIAVGLAAAHEKDIIHLDLTPSNVMMQGERRPRIMDFGLARLVATDDAARSQFKGTPRYITPDHLTSAPLTAATDIYALGLVFYELLTGQPARDYATMAELFDAVRQGVIDWGPLRERNVSPEVLALIRDMLHVEPSGRFAHAGALVEELDRVIELLRQQGNVTLALDFLKRRIRRRPEFPAFSNSLVEINRLTAEESNATFDELGRVIMRDYSMTNRLMKIANSAFFDRGAGGVSTVSQAVARLGLNMVRMVCNGLIVFDRLGAGGKELKDALVGSFVAGLIARGLVARHQPRLGEEAFVSGLFHHLGRHLVRYYLVLEHEDIEALLSPDKTRVEAEIEVLGTPAWRLGMAVAKTWNFPETIVSAMEPVSDGSADADNDPVLTLRYGAAFANDLTDAVQGTFEGHAATLDALMQRYCALCGASAQPVLRTVELALEKFADLAPSLEVDPSSCQVTIAFRNFLKAVGADEAAA